MNFNLNDDQQLLSDSLSRLLGDHYGFEKRRALAASPLGWDARMWDRLAELGVTALGIPEAFGGLGGGAADRLPVMQALGHALLLEPYLASSVLGATALLHGASDALNDELLARVASGELRLAWAHDEAAGRHAPLWVQAHAMQESGQWELTGSKSLVLHASTADRIVITARISGAADADEGLALFLVDAATAGMRLRSFRLVDDTPAAELTLDGAPAELLCQGTQAHEAIRATLAAGTAAVCADMVGTMTLAFELTTAYVNTRKQFGKLIGEYQALRHRVAEMAVNLEMARSMAIAAAVGVDDATELARAKLVVGKHARALCQAAIQSHGGIGMTEEYAVGHCLRRIHVLDQLFGDVDAQAARLGKP